MADAPYLSEKIGYARNITIYRHLEASPELRFHPIFKWIREWCNGDFRHVEAFALLMRANPHTLSGRNKLWIRFFLVAVFATMYVRDHARAAFHEALGVNIDAYDHEIFAKTSEISWQDFPLEIDIDNPRWQVGLDKMTALFADLDEAKRAGGLSGRLRTGWHGARAALAFAGLYLIPVIHELPAASRLEPAS